MDHNHIPIDRNTLEQILTNAGKELSEGHLSEALSLLDHLTQSTDPSVWRKTTREQFAEVSDIYKRMLYYMGQGMNDPMREKVYQRMKEKTHRIIQDMRWACDRATLNNIYTHWAKKQGEARQITDSNLVDEPGCNAEDTLFSLIWTAPQLTPDEEEQLRLSMMSQEAPATGYMLSALTLALMHYFDVAKLRLLLDQTDHQAESVRIRAFLGIAVATHLHPSAIALYPQLAKQITERCTASAQALETLTWIQYHVALYRESERIQQKIQQEIMPALIKVTRQRLKLGFEDTEIDLTDPDSMPNVSKQTRKKLNQGMQEMARMFHEGMDLNLQTFTSLKAFPFFQHVCHWLAPYDTNREGGSKLEAINHLPLCDNDKYSVAALMQHISTEQKQQLEEMLANHDGMFMNFEGRMIDEYQNVIQSFYRLLKRSPWSALWPDIFATMMLTDNPILGPTLQQDAQYLRTMGEMLLRNKHFEEAEKHLKWLGEKEGSDAELLMKRAFCMHETGKYARALDYYLQAQMLAGDDDTLLFRIQYCYAQLGRYREQLECLLKLEARHPDDANLLTETGLCLMQLERWDEAQKRFFKMEFNNQRLVPSLRAIAWCAFQLRDLTLAQRYYERILDEHRTNTQWEDYLNAAHVRWCTGDILGALPLYREYTSRYLSGNAEAKDALAPYDQDRDVLLRQGKSETEIALMHDLIARQL